MTPIERLQTSLTSLGLKAVEARLESLLEQAAKKTPGYAEFLDELLGCEVDARRTRYLRARLQLAHLEVLLRVDGKPWHRTPWTTFLGIRNPLVYAGIAGSPRARWL